MIRKKVNDYVKYCSGFSLIELLIIITIAAIIASIGIPAYTTWIPDYRLRNIAKELYADMYLVKMKAIKENKKYKIIFATGSNESYSIKNADGVIEKTVTISVSDSEHGISFGCGNATKSAKKAGGPPPDDGISYTSNVATFNPRGTGSSGYIYLHNRKGSSYSIGTLSSGVIFLKKWDNSSNSWK